MDSRFVVMTAVGVLYVTGYLKQVTCQSQTPSASVRSSVDGLHLQVQGEDNAAVLRCFAGHVTGSRCRVVGGVMYDVMAFIFSRWLLTWCGELMQMCLCVKVMIQGQTLTLWITSVSL